MNGAALESKAVPEKVRWLLLYLQAKCAGYMVTEGLTRGEVFRCLSVLFGWTRRRQSREEWTVLNAGIVLALACLP